LRMLSLCVSSVCVCVLSLAALWCVCARARRARFKPIDHK